MLFRQIQRLSSHVGCAANVMPAVFIAESSSNPTGCMPGEREREERLEKTQTSVSHTNNFTQ